MTAGRRVAVRAPRAAQRMSRQSAERLGSASCRSSKSADNRIVIRVQISAVRTSGICLSRNTRAAVNSAKDRRPNAGKLRKLGLRSAQRAMKSGIHGIDCMNGEPLKEAQAMVAASSKATSRDVSLRSFTRLLSNRLSIGVNGLGGRVGGLRPEI